MRTTVRLSNAREVPATEPVDSRDPIEVGSRLQLFLDDHLVESMRGLEFLRHIPQSAGSVFSFDQPWEGNTSLPLTVLRDGELCRLYYVGRSISDYLGPGELKPEETLVPNHPHLLCCAESRDGVEWTRPVVGVYEFDGCKENNILGNPVGFPFLDTRPEVDPSERYKAVAEVHIGSSDEEEMGVVLWVSPDGLRWRKWRDEPLFITSLPNAFNSINVLFWCESEDHYVFYFRYIAQGVRTFARTTSKDLRQWSEPVPCTFWRRSETGRPSVHKRCHSLFSGSPHLSRFSPEVSALEALARGRAHSGRLRDAPASIAGRSRLGFPSGGPHPPGYRRAQLGLADQRCCGRDSPDK